MEINFATLTRENVWSVLVCKRSGDPNTSANWSLVLWGGCGRPSWIGVALQEKTKPPWVHAIEFGGSRNGHRADWTNSMVTVPSSGAALQTPYNGIVYRSRTEARWACFFTELGIEFQYEPQGFRVDSTTCYLPDFFLPAVRTWAEVKPTDFSPEERRKLEVVDDQTKRPALFLVGHPSFKTYEITYPRDLDIAAPIYSTTVLDIDNGSVLKQYRKGRLYNECDGWWSEQAHFSESYRNAVWTALTNRFNEGGRW